MMRYILTAPEHFHLDVNLPPSKSISNRALIINALAGGTILPDNLSDCEDTTLLVNALTRMPTVINIGGAGTAMRFLTAYLSTVKGEHILTGTERMKRRPIGVLVDAMRYLGADIEYTENAGFPPLRIHGQRLTGGTVEVRGDVSSQFISALLMLGPVLTNGLELRLSGQIISRPYIDLTLHIMHAFGAEAEWSDVHTISVSPKPYILCPYHIESDWSAASYWYEILALCSDADAEVTLNDLLDKSRQGDSLVRFLFSMFGVKTTFIHEANAAAHNVVLRCHRCTLPRLDYDFVNSPDLVQTIVVTCAMLDIPFHFTGVASLRIKETDRIAALEKELRKLGYVLYDNGTDALWWDGERCPVSREPIDTYDDHRMAMAFAPASIRFPGLRINSPAVVRKSYPHFWDELRRAGFSVEKET